MKWLPLSVAVLAFALAVFGTISTISEHRQIIQLRAQLTQDRTQTARAA